MIQRAKLVILFETTKNIKKYLEDNHIFRNFAPKKNTGVSPPFFYVKFPKNKKTQRYTNSIPTLSQLYTNSIPTLWYLMYISNTSLIHL